MSRTLSFLLLTTGLTLPLLGAPPKAVPSKTASLPTKPALFIPYLGTPKFPQANKAIIDQRLTLPIYEGLPDKPYKVIGDIYVPTRPNYASALEDGMTLAVNKGADALILASDTEVHQQTVKGQGKVDLDQVYFRAWALRWNERPEILPDPQKGTELLQQSKTLTTDPNPPARTKAEREEQLRKELVENARKIEWANQGVVPPGFTRADYIQQLRDIEHQIIADIANLN